MTIKIKQEVTAWGNKDLKSKRLDRERKTQNCGSKTQDCDIITTN